MPNESERRDDLMATHQIRGMSTSLLFHGNAPPARITLHPYYKDKRFAPRLGEVLPPTPTPFAAPALDTLLPDEPATRPEQLDTAMHDVTADAFDELDELLDDQAEPDELPGDAPEPGDPADPDGEQA